MNKRKIFVVGPSKGYASWMEGVLVDTIAAADLIVFTGGEDVSPELYNSEKHSRTYNNSQRDKTEVDQFKIAKELGKPMLGICRGSQFLCVMAGGELVQHQSNPLHEHFIQTFDNKEILITSTHHQAQYPYNMDKQDYDVLAWTKGISMIHQDGTESEMDLPEGKEAEIVYYPKIKALGIQGHPEMMFYDYGKDKQTNDTISYCRMLLDNFVTEKVEETV